MPEFIHIGHYNVSEISMYIPHCISYEFQLGNNANAAVYHISAALSEGTAEDRTCRDWFKRFGESDT